jgi:hypothetical protein
MFWCLELFRAKLALKLVGLELGLSTSAPPFLLGDCFNEETEDFLIWEACCSTVFGYYYCLVFGVSTGGF